MSVPACGWYLAIAVPLAPPNGCCGANADWVCWPKLPNPLPNAGFAPNALNNNFSISILIIIDNSHYNKYFEFTCTCAWLTK